MPDAAAGVTQATLRAFLDAFNRHDLDAIMEFFAEDGMGETCGRDTAPTTL